MEKQVFCRQCRQAYEPSQLLRGHCPTCLFAQALPEGISTADFPPPRFLPPKVSELAPLFAQLEINELIGCGGMSAVYKARQKQLGRTVAVKILPQEVAAMQGGLERFQREARTLAQLNHPNIVQVFDAGQAGPWCFILMEHVAGPNLRQVLGESQLPPAEALRIASAICDGLQYAHDLGVVHRDIKPENVLLDGTGQVKLVDFGLAKSPHVFGGEAVASRTGQVVGTPHYLAPEQIETPQSVDHRADLYSLGVMIYEMLTGELPLGHFPPPSRRSGSDPALDDVVLQAMSKDRFRRHQQARDLQARLASAASGAEPAPRRVHTKADWSQVAWEVLLSGSALLAALVGLVAIGNGRDSLMHPNDPAQPVLGASTLVLVGLFACLLAFAFARINLSSRSSWRDVTTTQLPSLAVLLTAYAVLGVVLLAGPGIAIWLLGSLPLFANFDHWRLFGQVFTDADRASRFTPYWFTVYGIFLLTCAAWCVPLAIVVRKRPSVLQGVFHPTSEKAVASLAPRIALFVAAISAPIGLALLLASWLATSPLGIE